MPIVIVHISQYFSDRLFAIKELKVISKNMPLAHLN